MKHVKRLSCLALAAIMLFLCSGCGSPEPPPEQDWYYYLSDYSEWSSGSPLS